MSDRTITFVRTQKYELDFETWYKKKEDEYRHKDIAVERWEAMCDEANDEVEIEAEDGLDYDDVEDDVEYLENETELPMPERMEQFILKVTELFEDIGIKFFADYSCCMTCGHAEAKEETTGSYVFYNGQEHQDLLKGSLGVHLSHHIVVDETKQKLMEMLEKNKDIFYWNGFNDTTIFATYDEDEMKKHIQEDKERTERLSDPFLKQRKIETKQRLIEALKKQKQQMEEQIKEIEKGIEYL